MFIYVFHILALRRLRWCISGTCPVVSPGTVLWEPVGDGHGQAEETQADAVHLRGDGDVGKEGVVPAHEGIAAFKVFDNVEDLLALRLPHHPPNVQQGGDVLLPVGRKDTGRKGGRRVLMEIGSVWCRQRLSWLWVTVTSLWVIDLFLGINRNLVPLVVKNPIDWC